MNLLSGVPSGISTRPVFCTLPTSEKTLVPGLELLPISVNHAGPLATMGGMLYQVSTLLMLVGWPHRPFCAGIGRARARAAGASFQRADQCGFFAADECARALDQLDVEVEAAAQDILAEQAVVPGLRDGHVQPVDRQRVFGADIDDAMRGAGDVAADGHAFEQRMRVALDLVAVHVGARIALVGVADEVFPGAHCLAQILEFQRRSRNPAPPRPRNLASLICSFTTSGVPSSNTFYND